MSLVDQLADSGPISQELGHSKTLKFKSSGDAELQVWRDGLRMMDLRLDGCIWERKGRGQSGVVIPYLKIVTHKFRLWWDEGGRHFFIVCHLPSEIFPATTRRAVARTTGSSLLTTPTSSAAASVSEATDSANEAATKQLEIEYDADDEEGKLILPREVVSFRGLHYY